MRDARLSRRATEWSIALECDYSVDCIEHVLAMFREQGSAFSNGELAQLAISSSRKYSELHRQLEASDEKLTWLEQINSVAGKASAQDRDERWRATTELQDLDNKSYGSQRLLAEALSSLVAGNSATMRSKCREAVQLELIPLDFSERNLLSAYFKELPCEEKARAKKQWVDNAQRRDALWNEAWDNELKWQSRQLRDLMSQQSLND